MKSSRTRRCATSPATWDFFMLWAWCLFAKKCLVSSVVLLSVSVIEHWMDMGWKTGGQVMRLKVGGLLWGGVPCSSWVFLNRHTSKRSREAPLGDEGQPSVCRANLLVTRWTLLVLLAVSRGCLWLAEQPMSSLMLEHPRLKQVCELCQTPSLHTHLWHSMARAGSCRGGRWVSLGGLSITP